MADSSLLRSFLVELPRGYRYVVTEIPIANGAPLAQGDPLIRIDAIRETQNKDGVKVEEKKNNTYNFAITSYQSPHLVSYHVSIGQELEPGSSKIATFEVEKDFANLIEKQVQKTVSKKSDLHLKRSIPETKRANAIAAYAPTVDQGRVLFLYDSTVFGSAKEGYLITDSGFYYSIGTKKLEFRFNELVSHRMETYEVNRNDKIEDKERLLIALSSQGNDQLILDESYRGLVLQAFHDLLNRIQACREEGWTKEVDGYLIVEDMSDKIKQCYLNILVWLTYIDDKKIDARELREIQILTTQIRCSPKVRRAIRDSIRDSGKLDAKTLIDNMLSEAPSGSEFALRCSLIKDAIRLHRATRPSQTDNGASSHAEIKQLARLLDIEDDKVKFFEEACIQDEKILSGDLSDDEIVAAAKFMAAKAGSIGVPIAAIYLTGSVTGLSAAGITSGLAGLGLGGVLGLSSMVTGVGVAIILGVGVYKGAQWLLGGSERDKASRREIMLQEVLRIHQKAIGNVAEDVCSLALELIERIKVDEAHNLLIAKLGRELTLFADAHAELRQRVTGYERHLEKETNRRGT